MIVGKVIDFAGAVARRSQEFFEEREGKSRIQKISGERILRLKFGQIPPKSQKIIFYRAKLSVKAPPLYYATAPENLSVANFCYCVLHRRFLCKNAKKLRFYTIDSIVTQCFNDNRLLHTNIKLEDKHYCYIARAATGCFFPNSNRYKSVRRLAVQRWFRKR